MKTHRRPMSPLLLSALVLGACLSVWVFWPVQERKAGTSSFPEVQPVVPRSGRPPASAAVATPQPTSVASESSVSAADMGYGKLARHGVLVRKEVRRFEARKWEVDLAKALELAPNVRLERRSGVYQINEFKYPLVRVDRVYRMDRQSSAGLPSGTTGTLRSSGQSQPVVPSSEPVTAGSSGGNSSNTKQAASQSVTTTINSGADGLDAGGGELVWENAMVADHLMVQAQPGISEAQLKAALPGGTRVLQQVTGEGLYLVEVPADGDDSVERAVLALNQLTSVIQFAEPDFLMSGADTTPDDPGFAGGGSPVIGPQWGLPKIMAPRAWDVIKQPKNTQIANSTVVAVVDTGVDYTHPDLAANIWTNPLEIPDNDLDDDGNGKVDDTRGWDFVTKTTPLNLSGGPSDPGDSDPMDDVGHGTHVAGIIGAEGNNAIGVAGVCWGVKILPLRIIKAVDGGTFGAYSDAVAALSYIRKLNDLFALTKDWRHRRVAVANHSWGGTGYSLAMLNAINSTGASATDPLPGGLQGAYAIDANTLTVSGTAAEIAKIKVGMAVSGEGIPQRVESGTTIFTIVTFVNAGTLTLSDYTTAAGNTVPLTFYNPQKSKAIGVVHVAAAGNNRFNIDRIPIYPACLPSAFMLSVGASDNADDASIWTMATGSSYGKLNLDVYAPGTDIWSTKLRTSEDLEFGYELRNGTSMAAPHVSGALALVRMWQPTLTESEARQLVLNEADPVNALKDKCVSGGRLNVARMMDRLYQPRLVGSGGSTGGGVGGGGEALNSSLSVSGRMAAGTGFFLFTDQGKVFIWGNTFGTTGSLNSAVGGFNAVPVEVAGLDRVIMISALKYNVAALRDDGTVWTWDISNAISPTTVPGISDCTWISAGDAHFLAVKADGSVWAWGENEHGQIGDGTTNPRPVPHQVPGLEHFVQVAAGYGFSLALASDGRVWSWGARSFIGLQPVGTLGDGQSTGFRTTPEAISAFDGHRVAWIGANYNCALAVKEDGTVWQWGLLPGSQISSPSPSVVPDLGNIVGGSVGRDHALAINREGDIFAWGNGQVGQLGNGADLTSATPVRVQRPADVVFITCQDADNSSLAFASDGRLFAWGDNSLGQLGIGKAGTKVFPVTVSQLGDITSITADHESRGTYAVNARGELFSWGSLVSSQRPTQMTGINNVKQIISGRNSTFVIKNNGTLWGWGNSADGELGIGNTVTIPAEAPVQVTGLGGVVSATVRQDALRYYFGETSTSTDVYGQFALAVTADGKVHSWGSNSVGQLGDGTFAGRMTQAEVGGITGAVKVVAGSAHVLVLKSDGTVVGWGRNQLGQLGDGTTTNHTSPTLVFGLNNVVDIGAVDFRSFALKSDGTVWQWGNSPLIPSIKGGIINYVADDLTQPVTTPRQMEGLPLVEKLVTSSAFQVQAIARDRTLWTWGGVWLNARDPASILAQRDPDHVVGISGLVDCSTHLSSAFALKQDGTVWSWGLGGAGLLGDGESWSNVPVVVLDFGGASSTLSTLGTGSTSDSWFFQNFTVDELFDDNLVGDLADADADGIANLLEYALGLNPRQRNDVGLPTPRVDLIAASAQSDATSSSQVQLFSAPTVDLDPGKLYMALTVSRQGVRQDIDYVVEVSNDLVTWQSGDPHTVLVLDTAETLEVYSAVSLDDVPRQFMRLKIRRK